MIVLMNEWLSRTRGIMKTNKNIKAILTTIRLQVTCTLYSSLDYWHMLMIIDLHMKCLHTDFHLTCKYIMTELIGASQN